MRYLSFRGTAILTLAFLLVGLAGCGPRKFTVSGKVTYNDAVLEKSEYEGTIVFVGPTGEQVSGPIGTDGTYKVTGVVEGLNKVAITYKNPKHEKPSRPHPGGGRPKTSPAYNLTPEMYMDAETSELTVRVDKDTVYSPNMTGPPIK